MDADLGLVGVLLAVVTAGSITAARAIRVPSPVVLILAGVAASYIPGVPALHPPPDLIFLGFLPALVYHAAFVTSPRQLLDRIAPIGLLAIGLVVATMAGVAAVAHAAVGLPWAAAFVLGAVVAPTDPVAAGAVLSRMGAPIGMRTVLEGESLLNDGFALAAFGLAVAAASGGATGVLHVSARVAEVVGGGAAIGIAVGWIVERVRRRLHDPAVEILISLMTPYAAYLLADRVGASGVLAVVATGLWLGWRSAGLFLPRTRLQAATFWNMLAMLMNATLFLLIGLVFPEAVSRLHVSSPGRFAAESAAVLAATVALRLVAVIAVGPVLRLLPARLQAADATSGWRERLVIGWSGFRGAVSVAAALSIPVTAGGAPFPGRATVVYLTFVVVFGTLVVQGGLLPAGLRLLGFRTAQAPRRAELEARADAARAAIERIDEAERSEEHEQEILDALREAYDRRLERLDTLLDQDEQGQGETIRRRRERRRLRADILAAERERVEQLQHEGRISADEMRRIVRELDLEDVSMREGGLQDV